MPRLLIYKKNINFINFKLLVFKYIKKLIETIFVLYSNKHLS
jgi:hypothetical protein